MTFSIAALCPRTGQIGIAATTAAQSVGKLACHALPGVGAFASQARLNPYLAYDGLRRSEEHTSELQSRPHLVCRLLLEKKNNLSILRSYVITFFHFGRSGFNASNLLRYCSILFVRLTLAELPDSLLFASF